MRIHKNEDHKKRTTPTLKPATEIHSTHAQKQHTHKHTHTRWNFARMCEATTTTTTSRIAGDSFADPRALPQHRSYNPHSQIKNIHTYMIAGTHTHTLTRICVIVSTRERNSRSILKGVLVCIRAHGLNFLFLLLLAFALGLSVYGWCGVGHVFGQNFVCTSTISSLQQLSPEQRIICRRQRRQLKTTMDVDSSYPCKHTNTHTHTVHT